MLIEALEAEVDALAAAGCFDLHSRRPRDLSGGADGGDRMVRGRADESGGGGPRLGCPRP